MKSGTGKTSRGAWYDGRFFDLFIAPNQDGVFAHIGRIIDQHSRVLDVGCGTGRMEFKLANSCAGIDGVDASVKNIEVARRKLASRPDDRISFHHADAVEYISRNVERYDFAVLSFVIHEIDEEKRLRLLGALGSAADRIIMVDYMVPRPKGLRSLLDEVVEFLAGAENYKNYRSFVDGGGLAGLAERAGLEIVHELKREKLFAQLTVARRHNKNPG